MNEHILLQLMTVYVWHIYLHNYIPSFLIINYFTQKLLISINWLIGIDYRCTPLHPPLNRLKIKVSSNAVLHKGPCQYRKQKSSFMT